MNKRLIATIDYDYFKYMDKVCIHFTKIKLDDIAIQFFITEHHMSFACIVNPIDVIFLIFHI